MNRQQNRARAMMILSMAAFGTLAPFVRRISVASAELALYRAVLAALLIGYAFVFSHPDFTVGTGITPVRRQKTFADYTAGKEFHLSPKIFCLE